MASNSTVSNKLTKLGICICGHGSRHKLAVKEFSNLSKSLEARLNGIPLEFGYLEFARPIIREGLDKLVAQSVNRIIAIPAMLFAAGHAKNDIPALLKEYSLEKGVKIDYGRELGVNNLMVGAAGSRINDVIQSSRPFPLEQTLLVVVGRGSSDPDANSNVAKITRMLVEGFGFGWGETVFSGVTFPLVEPGLRQAVRLGFRRIIVFPYFLFSGVLINRIRDHTEKVALEFPEVEFLQASYLSDHPFVIETFQERIQEALNGDNSMNCSLCKYRSSLIGFEKEVGLAQESHHHHVEGLSGRCLVCNSENDCSCQLSEQELHDKAHHHHHYPYPHSNHPLGPVSLRLSKSVNSQEKPL